MMSWLFKMAWRDSRRNRSRLVLFMSSIIMGIAALVAINSFSDNLQQDIEDQAKTLLGADLSIRANRSLNDTMTILLDSIGQLGERAEEYSFSSMVYFPKTGNTRLTEVKAVEGNFPFYGTTTAEPMTAVETFKSGKRAVVERAMMLQFGVEHGDSVRVGGVSFEVEGTLVSRPGRSSMAGSIAPLVMVPMAHIKETGLIRQGSRINYTYYYKFGETVDVGALVDVVGPTLRKNSLRFETVAERKQNVGSSFSDMRDFLNLVSFIALLLGCIGVASAVHIYVKDKLATVAILRCLGASGRQAFMIYLIQILVMGLVGSFVGALLGSGIQTILPTVFKDFLPNVTITTSISWSAVLQGVGIGLSISVLFALLPLLAIRKTSPLRTLRASYEADASGFDPLRWLVYLLIMGFVVGFSYWQIGEWQGALYFTGFMAFAFLLLAGMAKLIMWAVRRFFPTRWSYTWRQSLANLYRPNNQTLILLVSIGLGTMLISSLFLMQGLLLKQVEITGEGEQPNVILFDIQTPQKEGVRAIIESYDLPVLQDVPIVTMRLLEINGISKKENKKLQEKEEAQMKKKPKREERRGGRRGRGRNGGGDDDSEVLGDWVYNREYRVTYRDTLINTEKVIEGEWVGTLKANNDTIPISMEEGYAENMKVKVGDIITFNIQGAIVPTVIRSIRKVTWNRVQTNFFVVFPKGVLEAAPQFHVLVSRVPDVETSARFQQALVEKYPNVSAIDLTLILKTVEDLLGKIAFVIRFMALFSIFTGLLVLISSIVISKYQRVRESVLLRTLGASRRQILTINALEYALLGTLAAMTGIGLSMIASWGLAVYLFQIPFSLDFMPIVYVLLGIVALVVLIGMLNTRDVVRKPPLEVLRGEIG